MKKAIIAILLSCIMGIAFAQVNQPLDGFWGIKWDSDIQTVKEAVKNKGGHELAIEDKDKLLYSGFFGGDEARILFCFYKEKLYTALVIYPYEANKVIEKYLEVKSQLVEKYGKPKIDLENFKSPYYRGDGLEERALRINKAFFSAHWFFSDKNEIFLTITPNLDVALKYTNKEAEEELDQEKQKKNLSDF